MYSNMGSSFPRLYLALGVTTIRTTGSVAPFTDLEIKKLIDGGRMIGPKMHITAPYLEGRGSFTPVMHELTGADDARRMVNFWADHRRYLWMAVALPHAPKQYIALRVLM